MKIAYRYGGIKKATDHIVDADSQKYYDKYAKTSSDQVVVNSIQDTRLDSVLRDLETRISGESSVPTQVGQEGKFLSTDGSSLQWAVVDALPNQEGNANNVLYTTGSTAYWAAPLKLTSSVYPVVSNDKIGSYGASSEAARADHKHPLPVYFIESYTTAVGGETELVLTNEQYPSDNRPTGFHLYRNGLLLTPEVDYTFDVLNKRITFSKACNARENIIIVLGYLIGDSNVSGGGSGLADLISLLTTDEIPSMDSSDAAIGISEKAARADHIHPHDDTKANIDSPVFLGSPRLSINPTVDTDNNIIATTRFVNNRINQSLQNIIPPQSIETAGRVLSSDGENVFWKIDRDRQELPEVTSDAIGKILSVDGNEEPFWAELESEMPPTISSNIGDVLTLDDNKTPIWSSIPSQLPSMNSTTANKILSNTGAVLEWVDNDHIKLSNSLPVMNDREAYSGISNEAARIDHKHPRDITKADLDSPSFTGNPQSPTPTSTDNSNSIATTEFVNTVVSREVNKINTDIHDCVLQNSTTPFTLQNVDEKLQDLGNLDTSIDTVTIDFSLGNHALLMINKDISITFTINQTVINGIPGNSFRKVSVTIYNGNEYTIEWPENVHWDGVYAPVIETVMTTIEFITFNNGDEWYAKVWGRFN